MTWQFSFEGTSTKRRLCVPSPTICDPDTLACIVRGEEFTKILEDLKREDLTPVPPKGAA